MTGMDCLCGDVAEYVKDIHFKKHILCGWRCHACGEEYLHPGQAGFLSSLNSVKHLLSGESQDEARSGIIKELPREILDIFKFLSDDSLAITFDEESIVMRRIKPSFTTKNSAHVTRKRETAKLFS